MSTQTTHQSNDFCSICQQNVNKIFDNVEKSIPQYQQSLTNFQQECLQSCKKIFEAAHSLQQEFANKVGVNPNVPEAAKKTINEAIEAANKAYSIQNKVTLTTIETAAKNIKTINDNAKSFADLNRSILEAWQPFWSPRQ